MRTRGDKGLNGTPVLDWKTTVSLNETTTGESRRSVVSGKNRLLKTNKLIKKMELKRIKEDI